MKFWADSGHFPKIGPKDGSPYGPGFGICLKPAQNAGGHVGRNLPYFPIQPRSRNGSGGLFIFPFKERGGADYDEYGAGVMHQRAGNRVQDTTDC